MTRILLWPAVGIALALAVPASSVARADSDFFPWWDGVAAPERLAQKCKGKMVMCGKFPMCSDKDWACCYGQQPCHSPNVCCDDECKEPDLCEDHTCRPSKTCDRKCDVTIWNGCANVTCRCKTEDVCFHGECCTPKKCKANQCGTPGDGCGGRLNCGLGCPPKKRCNVIKFICEPIPPP